MDVLFRLSDCRLPCPPWGETVQSVQASQALPHGGGPYSLAHSKRVLFRATLQYCMVLSSVTLALFSMTSVFSSDKELLALI